MNIEIRLWILDRGVICTELSRATRKATAHRKATRREEKSGPQAFGTNLYSNHCDAAGFYLLVDQCRQT